MSDVVRNWKLSVIQQQFSLPEALIYYIAKNPLSPKLYNKLIKCCKYFWLKHPVLPLNGLYRYDYGGFWKTYKLNGFQGFQMLKLENFQEKLWIHQEMSVCDHRNRLMASFLIPKIYRCDLNELRLLDQTLSFDELQKLTSSDSMEILCISRTVVKNDDGSIIPIEKLIEVLPKLQLFIYDNVPGEDGLRTITSETAANLNAIPHFPKIESITIKKIPESFDFDAFFAAPKVSKLLCNTTCF